MSKLVLVFLFVTVLASAIEKLETSDPRMTPATSSVLEQFGVTRVKRGVCLKSMKKRCCGKKGKCLTKKSGCYSMMCSFCC